MIYHSRFLLFGLVAVFGLHQAALADQPLEPCQFAAFEQGGQQDSIQLCGGTSCGAGPCCYGSLLGRCGGPCTSCCDAACGDGCGNGCCGNGCCGNGGCGDGGCTPWTLLGRAGSSYYSFPFMTEWGFSEGVTLGYLVNPRWGLYGSVDFNHTDYSTQVLGTVGVQKFGVPYADTVIERTSVWILFDQFADFEIGSDSYLHQFRFYTGIATGPRREIGIGFTAPTSDDPAVGALTPMGSSGVMPVGDSYVGPIWRSETPNGLRLDGTVGYSDANGGGVAAGLGAAVPMGANTDLFFNGKLSEGENYTFAIGMEFKGGRQDTRFFSGR